MASTTVNYDNAWAVSTINATVIANAGVATTATISQDGKAGTEISIEVLYGATATAGVIVYLLRDIDGTNFEAVADGPWSFEMPRTVSATHRRTITWYGENGSGFRVHLVNNSGAAVTATVRTKQFTIDTV